MPPFDPRQLQDMLTSAQKQAEELQQKMQQTIVDGSAGGGTVTVRMNGQKHVLSIKIDPEALQDGDLEMLQDLVVAAMNEAGRKVDDAMKSTMGGMLSGMNIPGLF